MKYNSVFEIIGPIMIGPSSSHTAGAVRIGQIAKKLYVEKPKIIDIHFYGSFAQTYRGHATDIAVVGGLLGFEPDDIRIRQSLEYAEELGIKINFVSEKDTPEHPNTVEIILKNDKSTMAVTGVSLGGGAVSITRMDSFPLRLSGENHTMLILHRDAYGSVASVTAMLAKHKINIAHMEVSRAEKGRNALMVIETDQKIAECIEKEIDKAAHVIKVTVIDI